MNPRFWVGNEQRVFPGPEPDVVTDDVLRFLAQEPGRPFALSVHYRAPHTPYGPVPEQDMAPFRDANVAEDAIWRAGGLGNGIAVRVVRKSPDEVVGFGSSRAVMATVKIDLRTSEVASPAAGDTAEIEGTPLHSLRLKGQLDKYEGALIGNDYNRHVDGNKKWQELAEELRAD